MVYLYFILIGFVITGQTLCNQNLQYDDTFIIETEGCIIPDISDERELIKAMSGPPELENCHQEHRLLESNTTHIWILKDVLISMNIHDENSFYCCYSEFSAENDIRNIFYSDCQQFHTVIKAIHEFVRVDCYYKDVVIYSDYFAFTPNEAKPRKLISKSTFNVLVLGLESMSRLNFERTMPKTAKFLRNRDAIELRGYNKVGYNSFPNLFPLLTGRSFNTCKTINCSFIWDIFRNAGYYTALGSDSTVGAMGSFEYNWPAIPTDYYLQPFMAETDNVVPNSYVYDRHCFGNKAFYKIVLNYINGLLDNLKDNNKLFGFFWEESVSHDHLKKPQMMDEGYLDFITGLENKRRLENTILIVLSDHGMRWGGFAQTRQGRLESQLPLFSIILPTSFKEMYKDAYENIKTNINRLTTPYDAYQTLVDLVNPTLLENRHLKARIKSQEVADGQSSLFIPVSSNRTCQSAGIPEAWCSCISGIAATSQRREATMAALILLDHINQILADFPQCQPLSLKKVLGNAELKAVTESGRTYTLTIEVTSGAVLQGTVRRERNLWIAFGAVARLNRYSGPTSCVKDPFIKLYCSCF